MQHETDHLDGKLIIDYLEPLVMRETAPKLRELELQYQRRRPAASFPSNEEIVKQLTVMQAVPVPDLHRRSPRPGLTGNHPIGPTLESSSPWTLRSDSSCSGRATSPCPHSST